MRDIKFRAWDEEYGVMEGGMIFPENNYAITPDGKLGRFVMSGYPHPDKLSFLDKSKTHILMQYTGKKDMDGKELYGGDIAYNPCNEPNHLEIIWSEYNGCWCLGDEDAFPLRKYQLDKFWKKVGNVHENPELLES